MQDLLLISIDSLRLDYAGRATHSRVHTPRFDAVSDRFAFTERCFSVASATRPVHMSLVSGLYPFEHGIQAQDDRRIRRGAPRLFSQLGQAGFAVALFSEAPQIFTGLDLGAPVAPLNPDPAGGIEALGRWLQSNAGRRRCLFLHYWRTHTPYGAADGKAMGETASLLRAGADDVVRGRYRQAVETVFEAAVAPLLERLDLGRWGVVLFGDHGESWTADELYHGVTVRNAVLRVPLYVHAPYNPPPPGWDADVVSLLDLYATLCGFLGVPRADRGYGVDLWRSPGARPVSYRWAGIRPGAEPDDDPGVEAGSSPALRWCVFDRRHKLLGETQSESRSRAEGSAELPRSGTEPSGRLVDTWTEEPVEDRAATAAAVAAHRRLFTESVWVGGALEDGGTEDDLLRRRLRDLGYLA